MLLASYFSKPIQKYKEFREEMGLVLVYLSCCFGAKNLPSENKATVERFSDKSGATLCSSHGFVF
jgi:hypothetical protein